MSTFCNRHRLYNSAHPDKRDNVQERAKIPSPSSINHGHDVALVIVRYDICSTFRGYASKNSRHAVFDLRAMAIPSPHVIVKRAINFSR